MNIVRRIFLEEIALFVSFLIALFVWFFEHTILENNIFSLITLGIFFIAIMFLALRVAHHAEYLAEKYGDPYGTIILTLSAVLVEVIMIGIMMVNSHNPELARDTIVAAIILDVGGLLGLSAFIGGIIHGVQRYNIDSSNSYLAIMLIAIVSAMVIPDFLPQELITNYNLLLIVLFLAMTFIFYRIQTISHSGFFRFEKLDKKEKKIKHKVNGKYHILFLVLSIVAIGIMSEFLSVFMSTEFKVYGLPIGLGALIVALISASPELLTALKAAKKDDMQTVVNIAFGAASATVLLTIPSMIILSYVLGLEINLGLTVIQGLLLGLIIILGLVHFNDGKLNRLEGFIFLLVFIIYIFLVFNGVA